MNETLKPYIARSLGLHMAAAAALALLIPRSGARPDKVYMIDFVGGPAAAIVETGPSSPAAAGAKSPSAAPSAAAPQAARDSVAVKGRRHGPFVLPRPSLLRGGRTETGADASAPTSSLAGPGGPSAVPAPGGASNPSAPGPSTDAPSAAAEGVSTDLPNFPYPWFLAQVRLMLWQAWRTRMPRLDEEGAVAFSILRNGSFTDLAVESSSGDADFDKAALAAVQAAAPFPALPSDFREPFLKIHLALKSESARR